MRHRGFLHSQGESFGEYAIGDVAVGGVDHVGIEDAFEIERHRRCQSRVGGVAMWQASGAEEGHKFVEPCSLPAVLPSRAGNLHHILGRTSERPVVDRCSDEYRVRLDYCPLQPNHTPMVMGFCIVKGRKLHLLKIHNLNTCTAIFKPPGCIECQQSALAQPIRGHCENSSTKPMLPRRPVPGGVTLGSFSLVGRCRVSNQHQSDGSSSKGTSNPLCQETG
jgi:hypothetical protein